jgi:hypothetical protein
LIPAVTGTEDNIIAAWLDDRNGDWDVYARLKSWETLSVAVSISPESLEIKHCENAKFTVIVENDGAEPDSYNLGVTGLPDGFVWEMETSIKDLPPGEFVELPLMVRPAYEQGVCENTPYSFSVKATSVTNPNISSTAKAEFTIKPAPCEEKRLTLSFHKGINIISIPFKNDWRLSDLIRLIGEDDVTMIIYYDYQDEKFVAYMLRFGENVKSNVPVQCGEGYVVVMKTDKQVAFEGYSCEDESIPAAPPLHLRVIPEHSALLPNYPNPFNPETWLPYQLADDAAVTISIYNQTGQLVRTIVLGHKAAGVYVSKDKAAYWDGRNNVSEKVANGVYFYTLQADGFTATRRMLIVK